MQYALFFYMNLCNLNNYTIRKLNALQCGNFAKLFSIRRIQNLRLMQIVKNISFGTKLSYICFQKESCDNLYSKTIFIRPRYLKRLLIKFVEFRHDNFKIDPFAQHLFMEWWGGDFFKFVYYLL